jgi:PAS domain S-box-containing protein
LVLGVRVTGAVAAHSYSLNAYTPSQLEFLVSVANQLAIAIENNRLLDTLHRRSSQLATLNQIAMAVTSLQPTQDLFRLMLQYLMQAIPLDAYFVGIFEPNTRMLSFPISYDSEQFWDESAVHIGNNPLLARVIEEGQSVLVNRTTQELNSEAFDVRYGDRSKVSCSLMLVPMQIGSRVIGVLSTQSYRMNVYTKEHLEFLQGAANQLAISFENARLFESLTRRTEQLATLNNIANAVSSLQDPDRVLDIVLEQMRSALPLDVFYIALYDEQTKTNSFPLMFDSGKKWQEGEARVETGSWIDQVLSTGKPLLLNRTPEEIASDADLPEVHFLGDKSKSSVSVMITPLHAGYQVIGVVSAQSYTTNVYSQDHLDFLTAASYQIATAIENSRLYGALQTELVERLRSERALRQSETRLRAIIEHIPYDMWLCDNQGRYTLQSAMSTHGIGDIRGKLPQEIDLPRAVKARWIDQHERVLRGEAVVDESQWMVDGELRDRITMLTPILDGEQVSGYVGLNIDITERKRYEESQRRYVQRLAILHEIDRAILTADEPQDIAQAVISRLSALVPSDLQTVLLLDQAAHTKLLAIQLNGEMQDANTLAMSAFFSGLNFSVLERVKVFIADDLPAWESILNADCQRRLEEHGFHSGIIASLTQREVLLGAVIVLSTQVGAFSGEHREIVSEVSGSLSIALSQSQLYSDVQNLNLELERRVLQRTAELEAANRDLEAFSYSVSHDLRAPLRGIAGYVTILQEEYGDQLDSEARNYMERIHYSAQRMGFLIDDLLTFSRVGRQSLQIQQFSARHLVQDVIQELMQDQDASRVKMEIGSLPKITADRSLVRQVFKNLLENALKYSRSQPLAQIQVACEDLGDEYQFMVRDNGVGFNMKYANKLFGVFERLHNSREFEGTGVGLAIVKQIVQRHGGRVWAESEPGQGAVFYLTFPKENLYAAE